jgi:hypothetical protein
LEGPLRLESKTINEFVHKATWALGAISSTLELQKKISYLQGGKYRHNFLNGLFPDIFVNIRTTDVGVV